MRVTEKERIILRVLGIRCCPTCKYFDSETNRCRLEEDSPLPEIFDLRINHWLRNRFEDNYKRLTFIGSGCSNWKGFQLEDLRRRKKRKRK